MTIRPAHSAESVNKVIDRVLLTLGESGPVLAGTKEFHMQEAMQAAALVRDLYSDVAKRKARKDCVSHLRASLSRPVAPGSSDMHFRTE
ncbi:hypothetical protein SAMN05660489_04366 [Pseudomonas sp. LAMO17WK12:I10]|nr:hypothetical protein H160_04384 [Pseudomonas sp. LAMO17WK12:I9]SNY45458.1 hypothetical protein SAMN05660489_04366 [Pseudomonas sp. LAMO17WK12:I10]